MRDLRQLEADIRKVEGIVVGLDGDQDRLYRPYPLSRPSPGRMKGREWVEQFERLYPDLDVTFPSLHLTLQDLRTRYEP